MYTEPRSRSEEPGRRGVNAPARRTTYYNLPLNTTPHQRGNAGP